MTQKFELTLEDIIDIFRAGVDRGNDEASSYDEVYQIKQYMQKLGYTIDKYGVTKVTK